MNSIVEPGHHKHAMYILISSQFSDSLAIFERHSIVFDFTITKLPERIYEIAHCVHHLKNNKVQIDDIQYF